MGTEGNGSPLSVTQKQTLLGRFTSGNLLAGLVSHPLLGHRVVHSSHIGWVQCEAVIWQWDPLSCYSILSKVKCEFSKRLARALWSCASVAQKSCR